MMKFSAPSILFPSLYLPPPLTEPLSSESDEIFHWRSFVKLEDELTVAAWLIISPSCSLLPTFFLAFYGFGSQHIFFLLVVERGFSR